jgi:hypothetical protein
MAHAMHYRSSEGGGMNSAKHAVHGVMSLVGVLAIAACSAAPAPSPASGPDTSEGEGNSLKQGEGKEEKIEDTEGQSRAASAEGSGAPSPVPPACGGLAKTACMACCQIAFPKMDTALKQTFAQCLCGSPKECQAECGTNFCAGQAPSAACGACMDASQVCGPATTTVCQATPECAALMPCKSSCK